MIEIVINLTLAMAILVFMIYPSMTIVQYLSKYIYLNTKTSNLLSIFSALIFSLIASSFLYFGN